MTLTFDCPWCGDPLLADTEASAVRCAACAVSVDLADPAPALAARPTAVMHLPAAAA